MLDKLPAWQRDLAVMLAATLASWLLSDVVPILSQRGGLAAVAGSALALALGALIPQLTRRYGAGATKAPDLTTRPPGA